MRRRGPLIAFLALGVLWGAWAALVPDVQAAVGASKGQLGLALLFVPLGAVPAMLTAGAASDRYGGRVLPATFVVLAGAALLPALPHSVALLSAALFAVGVASGAADVAMNAAVAEIEAARGTRLMQIAHALFSLGLLVGALATGVARQSGSGRLPILAAVSVVLLAAAAANARSPGPARATTRERRRLPRLDRALLPIGLACGAAFVIEGGIEAWSALFLERELDATPAVGAFAPAAYAAAMMIGRFSGQALERRLGDARLLTYAASLAVVGLSAAAVAPNPALAIAAFFVAGAGVSVAAPALFGAAGRSSSGGDRGTAVATVTTIGYLGFLVGPPAVGAAAEAIGLRASFALLALVAAALAVSAPRLRLPAP